MLATARTADAVSERVLAHLVGQYPPDSSANTTATPGIWRQGLATNHPITLPSSRDPAPHHPFDRWLAQGFWDMAMSGISC
jgi:hypothetical protein